MSQPYNDNNKPTRFNPKTKSSNSSSLNAAVIQLMAKELSPSQRSVLQKKGQDLKLQRELKHTQIKLRETQDQCDTVVEIIGSLEAEKDDLLSVNDSLQTKLAVASTEVNILEQKNKSLKELYQTEVLKYKNEADATKKQISKLAENIQQKDMAFNQAKEYQNKLRQQFNEEEDDKKLLILDSITRKDKEIKKLNKKIKIISDVMEELEDKIETGDHLKQTIEQNEMKIKELQDIMTQSDKHKSSSNEDNKSLEELTQENERLKMKNDILNEWISNIKASLLLQKYKDELNEYNNTVTIQKTIEIKKEKSNEKKITLLQRKLLDKDRKIEELMKNAMRVQHEKDDLQKEIDYLSEMAQHDLISQKEQMDKIVNDITQLGSRNSWLEKERDDLMQLLEDRDYENQMLKTGYGLHRSKTAANTKTAKVNYLAGDEYDEELDTLEFMANTGPIYGDDVPIEEYDVPIEEYEKPKPSNSINKSTADIIREYLHLTASVVSMKFPRIQHVSSEELINKVKTYQFWEYHDMMVRIMKTEEGRILAKEKAEKEKKKQENQNANTSQQSMLMGFRKFFAGGVGNAAGRSKANNVRNSRRSMVNNSGNAKKSANDIDVDTVEGKVKKHDEQL